MPANQWLNTRRRLLSHIKRQVQSRLGPETADLADYGHRYKAEFRRPWKESTKQELLNAIASSSLVLGSDFHALGQSQRTHLRILRSQPEDRKLVLALECLESSKQEIIDSFMRGRISEKTFLKRVNWEKRWGFAWNHYALLIELAKKRSWPVYGLNRYYASRTAKSLELRDDHAAKLIAKICSKYPDSLIYAVFGDLHLADEHLPAKLKTRMPLPQKKPLVIYQNSEKVYFKVASQGLENKIDVVRLTADKFCVLGTPPWVKWQSYLNYLEKNVDPDLYDDDGHLDQTDKVCQLIELIGRDFDLQLKVSDLSVYSVENPNLFSVLSTQLDKKQLAQAKHFIDQGHCFYLPQKGLAYLSQPTMNHAAALAGQYIHAQMCRRDDEAWKMPNDFLSLVWVEAVGYFMSKLVNHKRSARSLKDVRSDLVMADNQANAREALMLVVDQRLAEHSIVYKQRKLRRFRPRRKSCYLHAAVILGTMMGERLYVACQGRTISAVHMLDYLQQELKVPDFEEFYFDVVRKIEPVAKRLKSRKERL